MTQSPLKKNRRLFLSHLQVRVSVFESFLVKKNWLDNILLVFYNQGNESIDKILKYLIKLFNLFVGFFSVVGNL